MAQIQRQLEMLFSSMDNSSGKCVKTEKIKNTEYSLGSRMDVGQDGSSNSFLTV